jgi:hypothetical protein
MPEKEYWFTLYAEGDDTVEMYFRVTYKGQNVSDFVVQLTIRASADGERQRRIIRRYDCAHGSAHCDIYNRRGEQIRKEPLLVTSLKDASMIAHHDLKVNARLYVEQFRNS